MVTVSDQNADPPGPPKPCLCDMQAVENEISNALDDILYAHNLEWCCSPKYAADAITSFVHDVVTEPSRVCKECKEAP